MNWKPSSVAKPSRWSTAANRAAYLYQNQNQNQNQNQSRTAGYPSGRTRPAKARPANARSNSCVSKIGA